MAKFGARTGSRSKNMRARGLITELLGRPSRESRWLRVLGWLVRARAELTVVTGLVTGYILLRTWAGMAAGTALTTETVVVFFLVVLPGTRARMWAVTSRHRIWKCFVQTRTMTPDGALPYLYWSSPSPVGERIRVWLPAGLSVNDLHITEALAAACFATEARVEVNSRFTHLATIMIVRRDPYTGKRLAPSYTTTLLTQLTQNVGKAKGSDGAFTPLPDRDGLPVPHAPADFPTVIAAKAAGGIPRGERANVRRASTRTTNPESTSEPANPPPVVGVGGMDVSDYV